MARGDFIEKSHAELESFHYAAIRDNPTYRLECQMDVLREELSMSMPYNRPEPEQPQERHIWYHHMNHHDNTMSRRLESLENRFKALQEKQNKYFEEKVQYK
jgi:hypothetical protein